MSSSSFTGGGVSDLFTVPDGFTGRSMPQTQAEAMVAASMNNLNTRNSNHMGSHTLYRQQHQQQQQLLQQRQRHHLPSLFLDPSSQIAPQTHPTLMGKRNLSELHTPQNNPLLSNIILRSVKPRTFQPGSPLSPLSPMDLSMSPKLPHPASSVFTAPSSQRFNNVPLVQQHLHSNHSNQVHLSNGSTLSLPMSSNAMNTASFLENTNSGLASKNTDVGPVQIRGSPFPQESEKKIIDNRLLELEKHLLEDDNDDEGDGVSVVTNSEWSDTIQNLITPGTTQNQKLLSTSPTSSTTSSCSSSSSVVSPAYICSKQTLMEAASAIYEGKSETASEILTRLTQISKACGNSEQRLTDHMVSALKSRVNPAGNPPQIAELFSKEHAESTQLLYDVSPCFKLGFMTANLAILEATLDDKAAETKFHVIDFDIGLGNQYVNLLHSLSAQQNGKPTSVKITTVTDNGGQDKLQSVGDMLRCLAERVNVHFEFNVVSPTLVELSRESLGCDPDETIAVNFAFKLYRMPDESVSMDNPRDELLRRVKSLAPKVVTVVEQELNANTAPFKTRVSESCSYYGALLDSLESTVSRDNSDRVKVEDGLSRKLSNSIACEGRDRVERCEVFGKWRARMGMAGFQLKQMSQNVAELMWARLNSGNRVNPGFTVKEENGGICFGWMGRTLTVASAWR